MIHVIGNAAVDSVIRVERFPRPGETIVVLGASEDLGGKGANQAVVAERRFALSPRSAMTRWASAFVRVSVAKAWRQTG
jgi:sugar/nucleoside kinase (ribokinase family)